MAEKQRPFSVHDDLCEDIGFVAGVLSLLSRHDDFIGLHADKDFASISYVLTEAEVRAQRLYERIGEIDKILGEEREKGGVAHGK